MVVADIMTKKVITAEMDDTLAGIRKVFELNKCHHIPILKDERLVGMVSDRDILRELSPLADSRTADIHALNSLKKKAHQIMSRHVVTVSPDDTLEEATRIILDKGISCVPVMGREGYVIGILTKTDLLRHYANQNQTVTSEA